MRFLLLAIAVTHCGCYSITDRINSSAMDMRDCWDAHTAWLAYRGEYVGCADYLHYFGEGFRAGYRAVAEGGEGCPPALPPRKYWSVCYQNETGRLKILNWYNGYSQGALVAQREGLQTRSKLVTGDQIYRQSMAPIEIVIEEGPKSAPPLEEGLPPQLVPEVDEAPLEPRPMPPYLVPDISPAPPPQPEAETKRPPVEVLPLSPPQIDDKSVDAGEPIEPPAFPATQTTPALPAPPAVSAELPRPGEHPRLLALSPQVIWPVSQSEPWFKLQSDQPLADPADAVAGVEEIVASDVADHAAPAETPGRIRLTTLDGSVDVTPRDESPTAEADAETGPAALQDQ
jgi:hypothetical protein